jgi:hypothetical protein
LGLPLKHLLQKWDTPATPCTGSTALGQLTRNLGTMHPQIGFEFSPTDTEAQADIIVQIHD